MPPQHLISSFASSELLHQLESTLHHSIPLTRTMGVKVAGCTHEGLELCAPLEPNINHAFTAFGGSLAALTTITSWGMLWLLLDELRDQTQIIIQDSSLSYIRPVTRDFKAICPWPTTEQTELLQNGINKFGKGRIEMRSDIYENNLPCVGFQGRFVVLMQNSAAQAA